MLYAKSTGENLPRGKSDCGCVISRDEEKKKDKGRYRVHTETKVEMGRTYSKNEGEQVDQTLHRVATKEREEMKGTTKQKMAR